MVLTALVAGLAAAVAGPGASPAGAAAATAPAAAWVAPEALVDRAIADLRRARSSGDPSWIDRAGASLDAALATAPDHYLARRTRVWLLLSRHEFAAARRAADDLLALAPDDAVTVALLADACTEVGDYACADAATDRLAAMRPGPMSYTRVATLRALEGDRSGAIEALEAARAATPAADAEEQAWLLVHECLEHAALGDLAPAARACEAALARVPDHHLALPALASVRARAGRLDDAASLLERAADRQPSFAVLAALGDVEAARGDAARARRAWNAANAAERLARAQGRSHGRDAAVFLADHGGDLDDALAIARADLATRDDVQSWDALAWVLHRRGDHRAAMRAVHRALRLGTEDAGLRCHGAAIAAALERPRAAARLRTGCLALDPAFDVRQDTVARVAGTVADGPRLARAEGKGRP